MDEKEQAYFNLGISTSEDATRKNYLSLFPEEIIASILNAFIFNRPMAGTVGGDGFWVHQGEEDLFVAVFDCMGHGHLASMMTRVYTQTLQRIVETDGTSDPGTVLRYLHHKIHTRFEDKPNLQVGYGADVALIRLNFMVKKLEYAGAKMDLMCVRNGALEAYKADRMPIGEMAEFKRSYESMTIELDEPANFYLMSDGLKDLIGGPEQKKVGRRGVAELLEEMWSKPMMEQKAHLDNFVTKWAQSGQQLDDVLVFGFSV